MIMLGVLLGMVCGITNCMFGTFIHNMQTAKRERRKLEQIRYGYVVKEEEDNER
jgi:hypothetical protein